MQFSSLPDLIWQQNHWETLVYINSSAYDVELPNFYAESCYMTHRSYQFHLINKSLDTHHTYHPTAMCRPLRMRIKVFASYRQGKQNLTLLITKSEPITKNLFYERMMENILCSNHVFYTNVLTSYCCHYWISKGCKDEKKYTYLLVWTLYQTTWHFSTLNSLYYNTYN